MRNAAVILSLALAGCGGDQPATSKRDHDAAMAHDAKMLQSAADQAVANQTDAINIAATQAANAAGANVQTPPPPDAAAAERSK